MLFLMEPTRRRGGSRRSPCVGYASIPQKLRADFSRLLACQIARAGIADPVLAGMGTIAERPFFAQTATAKADRRLAGEVPLLPVGILQNNVAFDAQRAIRPYRDVNCFLCHVDSPLNFKHSSEGAARVLMPVSYVALLVRGFIPDIDVWISRALTPEGILHSGDRFMKAP
jgi:hypothetical protein